MYEISIIQVKFIFGNQKCQKYQICLKLDYRIPAIDNQHAVWGRSHAGFALRSSTAKHFLTTACPDMVNSES